MGFVRLVWDYKNYIDIISGTQRSMNGASAWSSFLQDLITLTEVRPKLETLDGIVPPTHGFMINSAEMKNVWLSTDHLAILWCNQLAVQVSHSLLSLVDPETRNLFTDRQKRLAGFTKILHSGLQHGSNFISQPYANLLNDAYLLLLSFINDFVD